MRFVWIVLFLPFLTQCASTETRQSASQEVLQAPGFRLLSTPQEVVPWRYHYLNRAFPPPPYRAPDGAPLAGWRLRIVPTRRFFTNRSARVYYRLEELNQSHFSLSTGGTGAKMIRIWPVGAILVLETFAGNGALSSDARPVSVDCMRKFEPGAQSFPRLLLFAGEWCYQRFDFKGRLIPPPEGVAACHRCHSTAFHLTGDLVFTVISEDR
ncbi:MAG: hypothetical protein JSU72_11875 [Deltaproteobacteria bacterium]|nr:MAG: hypothetical protein JSU72_11875 [Deltaproteobacteria bacterium]